MVFINGTTSVLPELNEFPKGQLIKILPLNTAGIMFIIKIKNPTIDGNNRNTVKCCSLKNNNDLKTVYQQTVLLVS